jgi:type III secretion protein T
MIDVFDYVGGFAFYTIRPAIALGLLPYGTNGALRKTVRAPLVLMLATLPAHQGLPPDLLRAAAMEAGIGLALGLMLGIVFHVASTAGALLDQQAGYTIAAVYDPAFGGQSAMFQTLFTQFAALTFFTGDGLKALTGLFVDSWVLWPAGVAQGKLEHLFEALASERLAWAFAEGLRFAAPLVFLLILADVSLGLMARHAKRLNPFSTARGINVMVLSLAAAAATPTLISHLLRIVMATTKLE